MKKSNIEFLTKEMTQIEWKRNMVESGMDMMPLSEDTLSMMRTAFEIGFNSGNRATMDIMRDIFHSDIDVFQDLFEFESGDN